MNRIETLAAARKQRTLDKRRAVEAAMLALTREGQPLTFRTIAKRAGVSRTYLYQNYRNEIGSERADARNNRKLVGGKVVPLRTMEEYLHIEAVLRNKLARLEAETRKLRDALRGAQVALEHERGNTEHWRLQYELALTRQASSS